MFAENVGYKFWSFTVIVYPATLKVAANPAIFAYGPQL